VSRRRIAVLTLAVYSTLSALAFGWGVWRGRPWIAAHPSPWLDLSPAWALGSSALLGVSIAAITIFATRVLVRRARWASELHVAFREMLGPLDAATIAILALTSGIGEELFFRGAMQPSIGLVITAFVFGAVHVGPDRRFLAWTAWAVLMGFVLGAVHEATGSLLGPIIAHVVINYENLQFISSYDPRDPRRDVGAHFPRLYGGQERR
jgi:uncharacterized protein